MNFKSLIRTIPDFPKPGIMFRDITPLLASGVGFRHVVAVLAERYANNKVDKIVGIEARGFIFGAAMALQLPAGFVPIRKPGKLPYESIGHDYELEYGTNRIEMHVDGIAKGERVVVVDDLLATGGTALAALALVERSGASIVECAFVIELADLPGRKRIEERGTRVHALCSFTEAER
jgi:adenine phosphoribosyltransferase